MLFTFYGVSFSGSHFVHLQNLISVYEKNILNPKMTQIGKTLNYVCIVKSQDLSNIVKTCTKIYRRMLNLFDFDMKFTATFG
jgi:hypothetical protein